jgi:tetratricopeptide (TPR) repeat protein
LFPCFAQNLNDLEGQWVNPEGQRIIFNRGATDNDLLATLPGMPGPASVTRHDGQIKVSKGGINCFYDVSVIVPRKEYVWNFTNGGSCPKIGHLQTIASACDIYVQRGVQHLKDDDTDSALAEFRAALSTNPKCAHASKYKGDTYFRTGDYDKSIESYHDAIIDDPMSAEAYDSLGRAYLRKFDYKHAIESYSSAISINDNKIYRIDRADAYYANNNYSHAIQDYTIAISQQPDLDYVYNARANSFLKLGDNDSAIRDYRKSLSINPQNADSLNGLNIAQNAKGTGGRPSGTFGQAITPKMTLWRQNDSIMSASVQGEKVEIRYVEPTDLIKNTGVVGGDIKFKGKKTGLDYTGKAYIHTRYCDKGFAYDMSGSESVDHKTIVLNGPSPRIDRNTCQIVDFGGSSGSHLEFTRAYDLEAAGKLTATK